MNKIDIQINVHLSIWLVSKCPLARRKTSRVQALRAYDLYKHAVALETC
jgi:hypothetical protein